MYPVVRIVASLAILGMGAAIMAVSFVGALGLVVVWVCARVIDRLRDWKGWMVDRWRRFVRRVRGLLTWRFFARVLGFLGGIFLAGLPTYYAIFTVGDIGPAANHVKSIGWPLFAGWLFVAAAVGYLTLNSDRELLDILRPARRRMRGDREYDVGNNAVELLLEKDERFRLIRAFHPQIYVCDDRKRPTVLYPFAVDHPAEWQRFRVGFGAVGAAFEQNKDAPLVFKGADLARQNQSLTPEQLVKYGHFVLVAAIVLRDRDGRKLGALGVSSDARSSFGPKRLEQMSLLASELGILVDYLL